jgi:hypothetical protein
MMSLEMELEKKKILTLAAPNVFTFMLGQQSLLLPGNITLYEYDFDSRKLGAYTPTFTL